jgi:hypothetical protein
MRVSLYCLDSLSNRGDTMQVYTDCKRRLLLTFNGVQKALLCRARSAGRRCAAVHMPRHRKWYSCRKCQLTLAYVLSISYFLIDLFCFLFSGGGGEGFPYSKAAFSLVFFFKDAFKLFRLVFSIYYVVTNFFPQPLRSDF